MRAELRIVAGTLRGRRLKCTVHPGLRPAPQVVREALFSMLGDAVPNQPFFDLFAGTGAVGLEALSRGAVPVTFVEHDFRLAQEIERHMREFGVGDRGRVERADAYRWAERWQPPGVAVNVFLGPPYPDLSRRPEALLGLLEKLQHKMQPGSIVVLQAEQSALMEELPDAANWDRRRYGRNWLLLWVKPSGAISLPAEPIEGRSAL